MNSQFNTPNTLYTADDPNQSLQDLVDSLFDESDFEDVPFNEDLTNEDL